mmetsp:Transcript_40606/g.75989  ORF Transcript_40606/g.75989 Transcript_40606/m.75989 type:complete len:249 (-) Transcript_40606:298-1044(-)
MATVAMPSPPPAHRPSEEDEDLKLARQLQEQERAYFLLSTGGFNGHFGGFSPEDESEALPDTSSRRLFMGSLVPNGAGRNPGDSSAMEDERDQQDDDEAFARALQAEEQREVVARLMAAQMSMAGGYQDDEDRDSASASDQDDTDPDNMTYEQLTALGECVGTEQRGVAERTFSSLPEIVFEGAENLGDAEEEQCVICRTEFETGETLTQLPCKHHYHGMCIQQWLTINKLCPMCSKEVGDEDLESSK